MNGFLNLLKPPGMSSGAAVAVVKRLTGERVGHAGTLDPEACGVLPVMVGRATRLLDYFSDKEKEYIAQIAFGTATDTQDAQGVVVQEHKGPLITGGALQATLPQFTGDIKQCPPAYSAIKRDGTPLYLLARKGEMVQTQPRDAHIEELVLCSQVASDAFLLRIRCGKGTYIRTLCHDIGVALGCPAHMRFLLRTQSGPFTINNAVTLEEVSKADKDGTLEQLMLPMLYPLENMRKIHVPISCQKKVLNGVSMPGKWLGLEAGERACLLIDDRFVGIVKEQDGMANFPVMLTSAVAFETLKSNEK